MEIQTKPNFLNRVIGIAVGFSPSIFMFWCGSNMFNDGNPAGYIFIVPALLLLVIPAVQIRALYKDLRSPLP